MAIEYSGYVTVPRDDAHGGGTVQIPFNFQSSGILTADERQERAREIYENFRSLITDYDDNRQGQYGDIMQVRFTSVVDIGFQRWEDPYAGEQPPAGHAGR